MVECAAAVWVIGTAKSRLCKLYRATIKNRHLLPAKAGMQHASVSSATWHSLIQVLLSALKFLMLTSRDASLVVGIQRGGASDVIV